MADRTVTIRLAAVDQLCGTGAGDDVRPADRSFEALAAGDDLWLARPHLLQLEHLGDRGQRRLLCLNGLLGNAHALTIQTV